MRPSLNPLFCSSLQNAHLINRCGLPPQGGQLCFGGQPYIFRLTPANGRALDRYVPTKRKIGVTLDIYSAKGDMHESQAHLDLFLGQAILESFHAVSCKEFGKLSQRAAISNGGGPKGPPFFFGGLA